MKLDILAQVIPHLLVLAALAGAIGWAIRGKTAAPPPNPREPAPRERPRSDAALEQARAAQKSLKTDLETLRASSVPRTELEATTAELESTRQSLAAEQNRAAALDADLKKSRETIRQLSARTNEADKTRNDRAFALENELSKAREQLTLLQSRPDDTAELQTEIERLRESVATTTRYAGELRKREAAANDALAKLQERLAQSPSPAAPAPTRTGESDRVRAAKAEVARLNALRDASPPPEEKPPAAPSQPQLEFPEDPQPVEPPAAETLHP